MKRFDRIKEFLETLVNNQQIGVHGNFWRNLDIEEFKVKRVLGRDLLVVGDGAGSNLIKALEGRAPFGSDIGTPGATLRRMPGGLPAASPEVIAYIRVWIDDGCPDDVE